MTFYVTIDMTNGGTLNHKTYLIGFYNFFIYTIIFNLRFWGSEELRKYTSIKLMVLIQKLLRDDSLQEKKKLK